jgi:hypothetical protein
MVPRRQAAQPLAHLLVHSGVPRDVLHAAAYLQAGSMSVVLPQAERVAGQPQAAEGSSGALEPAERHAARLRAEPAALEAQHAAEAREAPQDAEVVVAPPDAEVALPDAGLAAVVLPDAELVEAAALSDAEPVAAPERRASPAARPWPAAGHPSAAVPSRAPWFPLAAAAPPPLVRFAHAQRSLRAASQ